MPAKVRIPARARAAASRATTVVKARTLARARVAAQPTVPRNSKTVQSGVEPARFGPHPLLKAMPANRFNGFKDYGIGIGLRILHYAHIFERKPFVAWLQTISES